MSKGQLLTEKVWNMDPRIIIDWISLEYFTEVRIIESWRKAHFVLKYSEIIVMANKNCSIGEEEHFINLEIIGKK